MSQVGRIGGQLLDDNLLRAGVDLSVETDLLYLDVSNQKISINQTSPIYDLDVNLDIHSLELTSDNTASIDNIRINTAGIFTTSVGGIDVYIAGSEIFHDRLTTANLVLDGNLISSVNDSNIVFDPNGSGTLELAANTLITGNLAVSGNISMDGDLIGLSRLILGDQILDTVTVNTDFTQDILPGDDLTYTLGWDAGDSSPRRWAQLHSPDWTTITKGGYAGDALHPLSVTISGQTKLDGVNNQIFAQQSNEDITLNPDTGIVYIERTKWEDSDITNLNNTSLNLAVTGPSYYRFAGDNGMLIPAGTDAERTTSPELGETRWNTDQEYLECFDGSVWTLSTGGGDEVTETIMNDLGNVWTLVLG